MSHQSSPIDRLRRAGAILAVVFAVLLSGLTVPAHAVPSAPGNLLSSGSPIPTLSWDRVSTASRYRVQGSVDSSFTSFLFNQETTNSRYTPTRVLRTGTLYWRVQATDATGTSGWSQSETSIGAQPVPANLTISAGQTVLPPASPPVIRWEPVAGATGYDLELDANNDGVDTTIKLNIRTTTYVWPDPQGVGESGGTEDFFVRVRAKFENSLQSEWSTWASYIVGQLPAVTSSQCDAGLVCAPDPVAGVRASRTVQDVVLDWDPVRGAKQYEIWVALDRDFNTQVEKRTVFSTRYSPPTTYDNNNYFWKVRAINAAGQPTPWPATPNEFARRWPLKPTPLYPASSNVPVGDDFYFQWKPVRHATSYVLDVGTDLNFSDGTYQSCGTPSTTFTPGFSSACMPPQGVPRFWRVHALDAAKGVIGLFSDVSTVVYDSGNITPISPANGSTVTVPTFRWQPSLNANKYTITVVGAAGSVTKTTSALSWTPTDLLPTDSDTDDPARVKDRFEWSVSAIDANGHGSPTSIAGVVFVNEAPVPAGASPLTPLPMASGQLTSRFPALAWQPMASTVDNPIYYRLVMSETPGFIINSGTTPILATKLAYPAVTDLGTYFLKPGTLEWWVEAYDANTNVLLGTGTKATFTMQAPPRTGGQQVALDGLAIDHGATCTKQLVVGNEQTVCTGMSATPVLDWQDVPGAGGYQVYVSDDSDFTNVIYNGIQTINSRWTPAGIHNPEALPDNESGPAYYWYIRPCTQVFPTINCGPGPSGSADSGTSAFRKVSPRVKQTSPADNATFADEVTLQWEDYYVTNQATVAPDDVLDVEQPPYQTAKLYRVQVAQSATITDGNAIDDRMVDQATYTAYTETYPEGDLWWRVQAVDSDGNRLAWSTTLKLIKRTPAANLNPETPTVPADAERATVDPKASPAFNTHQAAGIALFQWTAETFDSTWDLEVYRNDDTTASAANLVFKTVSKQAAFASPSPLAPSSEPYRWRIRRTDVAGQPGRWSDYGRFYVDYAAVSLTSPAEGDSLAPNGASFSWAPYSSGGLQATRYVIDVDPTSGGTNPGGVTTFATAWELPTNLVTGSYTWSVKAYDTAGGLLGSSVARGFTVNAGLSAVTPTRIEAPNGSAVGQTLTSVAPSWNQPGVENTYQWLRNGSGISGATGSSYVLTVADYTKTITLRVTGAKPGYTNGESISNGIGVTAGGALQNTAIPMISGTASVGNSLQASNGSWSPAATRFRYQWLRDGAPIPGATSSSYRPAVGDAGRGVSVTVFAGNTGFNEGSAASSTVTVAKLVSTTAAALSKTRIKPIERVKIGVAVTVPGVTGPTGTIMIFDGAKKLKTLTLLSTNNGKRGWKLPRLKVGKHKIKAVYSGNGATAGSKSKITALFVVR